MRLSHSISMTLFVSALAALPGCSEDAEPPSGTGGTGVSGSGGSATGGSGVGGSAGSAVGGSGGSGVSGSGGSGGSATGGSGGGALDYPTDTTQAGIEAYLMMELYKGAGWRPETMPGDDTMIHGATNRFFNETIIASKAAGNRPPSMGQHTPGSMSVKEILEGTTVIGKATTLRTDTTTVYYCKASVAGRCGSNTMADVAFYGTGSAATTSCACHGSGTNTSHDAIPLP